MKVNKKVTGIRVFKHSEYVQHNPASKCVEYIMLFARNFTVEKCQEIVKIALTIHIKLKVDCGMLLKNAFLILLERVATVNM